MVGVFVGVFASFVCVVVASNMNVSDGRCVCIVCVCGRC